MEFTSTYVEDDVEQLALVDQVEKLGREFGHTFGRTAIYYDGHPGPQIYYPELQHSSGEAIDRHDIEAMLADGQLKTFFQRNEGIL